MATRKSDLPTGKWDVEKGPERRLAHSLRILTGQVKRIAQRYDTVEEITAHVAKITTSATWRKFSVEQAVRMVQSVAVQNARTWREAARRGQKSRQIHQALKAELTHHSEFVKLIRQNANYITALPDDVARHITKHASTQAIRGMRAESAIQAIKAAAPEISHTRAQLIARTETAKAQAAITQIRAQQVGVQWYIWQTAEDSRVRSSHKHMQGVACQYSSPPSPEQLRGEDNVGYYGPGEIWNCRCYAEPIIDPDFLPNSLKVVQGGQIVRMSRKKFEAIQ